MNYIHCSKWLFEKEQSYFLFFSSSCDYRLGSILFASNITLISNLSEDQTINLIEQLIKTVNNSKDNHLHFDLLAHYIKRTNEISQIHGLFKRFTRIEEIDYPKEAECISF